jgi:hypothetical protein
MRFSQKESYEVYFEIILTICKFHFQKNKDSLCPSNTTSFVRVVFVPIAANAVIIILFSYDLKSTDEWEAFGMK